MTASSSIEFEKHSYADKSVSQQASKPASQQINKLASRITPEIISACREGKKSGEFAGLVKRGIQAYS